MSVAKEAAVRRESELDEELRSAGKVETPMSSPADAPTPSGSPPAA
jgi:hypothetical protein